MNDGRPTHLDLFSGIGGFALAARWAGFRTIGFCEIDKYCRKVLAKNFVSHDSLNGCGSGRAGRFDSSGSRQSEQTLPIFGNIRELDGTQFRRNGSSVTLVTGGFPCQPFSCAGKRRGKEDNRHLWPEMLRIIKEARPAWVLGENVAGIIGMELDTVLSDLETQGYTCRPFVIPACGVDARHRRNRVWIVGHAERAGSQGFGSEYGLRESGSEIEVGWTSENVADAQHAAPARQRRNGWDRLSESESIRFGAGSWNDEAEWQPEPDVGRVAHGIPSRVDRLRGLGNAIVPQVAFQILKVIREQIENEKLQTPNPDRAGA